MATPVLSGTNIRLLREVPFNADYKHTRYFDNVQSQINYFEQIPIVHRIDQANFQVIEGKNFIAVNESIDSLWGTNYLRFRNTEYNNKWFYAFVTKLEYKQKKTTYVHFEIDVYQTWLFQLRWKPSFIVRQHTRQYDSSGMPIINTVDEGLDYGNDYDTVGIIPYKPLGGYKFMVIVSKTLLSDSLPFKEGDVAPTTVGVMQPLSYYLIPFNDYAPYDDIYVRTTLEGRFKLDSRMNVLEEIYTNEAAVNNIVSIYTTEHIGVDITVNGDTLEFPSYTGFVSTTIGDSNVKVLKVTFLEEFRWTTKRVMVDKYSKFRDVKESKLLMYPYVVMNLTDYKGNTAEIKPEYIFGKEVEIVTRFTLGTNNKVSYAIKNYNKFSISDYYDTLISIGDGMIDTNPNDVPIITEHLASFLQGNRNTLQNQKASIYFNGVANVVGGAASTAKSAIYGNIPAVAEKTIGTVQGMGNSILEMQGMMAKLQDISNVPPQIQKMGGNTAFDFGNRYNGVFLEIKQIKPEYIRKLEGFFHMFGYKVNEVKLPNFKTRQHFNFIQTKNCTITGNINNEDLMQIRAIFDNGITLWHTNNVGDYSLQNGVI